MNDLFPEIKTSIVRIKTDKPVRKTPYQVKGVFMKKHSNEPITPMLDGSYRKKFSYPRVQVKILNEQISKSLVNDSNKCDKKKTKKVKWVDENVPRTYTRKRGKRRKLSLRYTRYSSSRK